MNRKRQRTATAAPAASLTEQPPKQQYFRYVAAPEDTGDDASNGEEDGSTINTNPRYVGGGFSGRGLTQREVDEVDIPAPTEWLCHDAAASSRLRTNAQTDLQLYPSRRPHHLPHSARQQRWMRDPAIGVTIARTLGSSKLGEDLRQERVICGDEVLPWGTWPARLRHHEGQSFYRDEDGGGGDDGGGYGGSTNFHASGGGVGRSGSVGGVGVVSEGSIHDELLRRQFPSLCSSSSSVSPSRVDQEENAVRRLVPNKRGRWVDAKTRRTPLFPTAAAAAAASSSATLPLDAARATSASAGNDGSPGVPPSLPPPRGSSAASTSTTIRLIPSRYGGWVEFEESGKERDNETAEQRQRRRAAVTMTARFGANGGEDCRAKEATGEGTGGGAGAGQGGDGIEGFGAANRSHFGGRRNRSRSCDANGSSGAGASSRGLYQGDPGEQGDESDSACDRRGWTVSDPAKETVRRVWNRARRRARDSFAPRHRAPPEAGDNEGATDHAAVAASDAADAPPAVHGAAVQDRLDPALLSCLGRECEGIIDATLHVLLADQLRRLQSMPPTVSSSAGETRQSVPSQPPPPLETADWQDVLRAMRNCSEGARGSRTPATGAPATAAAAAGAGTARSSSNAAAVHPGQERASKGRDGDGGDGVPERTVIEKEVWGKGGLSDGSVVVVNERLPGLPLNEAVLTRAYNRLLLYLYEKKTWQA
ncbi:unnamed protein product [Scytosiphon promiscuus]